MVPGAGAGSIGIVSILTGKVPALKHKDPISNPETTQKRRGHSELCSESPSSGGRDKQVPGSHSTV